MRRSSRPPLLIILAVLAALAFAPAAFGAAFGVAKSKWKSPDITTVVTAPGPGTLSQNGQIKGSGGRTIQVCVTSADATAEGPVTLACEVDQSTLKALRKRAVRIHLTTIFVGADGTQEFKETRITLPRKR